MAISKRYVHKKLLAEFANSSVQQHNVLISDECRGLITDFRPYHVNLAAAGGSTVPFLTNTLRFTAPELVKNSHMLPTTDSDVWSVGCLIYEVWFVLNYMVHFDDIFKVLSGRVPYYEYTQHAEIRSVVLSQGKLLVRPVLTGDGTDEIDDQSWEIIAGCCITEPKGRLKLVDVQNRFRKMGLEDNRLTAKPLPGTEALKDRRPYAHVDIHRVEAILDKLRVG
jgi:serine/threonine protein kinase